jgi:hypothetical protein
MGNGGWRGDRRRRSAIVHSCAATDSRRAARRPIPRPCCAVRADGAGAVAPAGPATPAYREGRHRPPAAQHHRQAAIPRCWRRWPPTR